MTWESWKAQQADRCRGFRRARAAASGTARKRSARHSGADRMTACSTSGIDGMFSEPITSSTTASSRLPPLGVSCPVGLRTGSGPPPSPGPPSPSGGGSVNASARLGGSSGARKKASNCGTRSTRSGGRAPGILRAFRASDVSREIYNSDMNGARDALGDFTKFAPPVVANGKVYVPTQSKTVTVYGLLRN